MVRLVPINGGMPTAGNNYSLECNITRRDTLSPLTLLEAIWLDPEGNLISTGNDSNLVITGSSTTEAVIISLLTFRPLRTSHAGEYTCLGNMTIPDSRVTDLQMNETTSVIIASELKLNVCVEYLP